MSRFFLHTVQELELKRNAGDRYGNSTLWAFGRTVDGRAVAVQLMGFCPSFLIDIGDTTADALIDDMNEELGGKSQDFVVESKKVTRRRMVGYDDNRQRPLLEAHYKISYGMHTMWSKKIGTFFTGRSEKVYHHDIPLATSYRMMSKTRPFSWVVVDDARSAVIQRTSCEVEVQTSALLRPAEGDQPPPPPILCMAIRGQDAVWWRGTDPPGRGGPDDVARVNPDLVIFSNCTERTLERWVINGVNMSRVRGATTSMMSGRFCRPAGRMTCDLVAVLSKTMGLEPLLEGYTLLDAVHHPQLLNRPDADTCGVDDMFELDRQRNIVGDHIELASLVACDLSDVCNRGQKIRTMSKLLFDFVACDDWYVNREQLDFFITVPINEADFPNIHIEQLKIPIDTGIRLLNVPRKPPKPELTGGFVHDPVRGAYISTNYYIDCWDFGSLYPSIIIAKNICYSTLIVHREHLAAFEAGTLQAVRIPVSSDRAALFVCDVPSCLPTMLKELLKNRNKFKKAMKSAQGREKMTLNSKQLACKVVQNAAYGFTNGVSHGGGDVWISLAWAPIQRAVCSIGRHANMLCSAYLVGKGYPVIYGDTDSIMCLVPAADAVTIGKAIEAEINHGFFPPPMAIEFEKVIVKSMFADAKTYVMLMSKPGAAAAAELDIKGFGATKRDRAPIVRQLGHMVVNRLLDGTEHLIVDDLRCAFDEVLAGNTDPQLFELTVAFAGEANYKNKGETLKQVKLAKRVAEVTGREVAPGTRLRYVVTKSGDAVPVLPGHAGVLSVLELDLTWYFNTNFGNAIDKLMQFASVDTQQGYQRWKEETSRKIRAISKKQLMITSYFGV
jgi:DNA polymerase elongation subunit (family B)